MTAVIIISFYLISLLVIFFYAVIQFTLALAYIRNRNKLPKTETSALNFFPFVTVQLPIYNEKYVVEKLLQKTTELNWPADKLEIQVLDDSTDETKDLLHNLVNQYQQKGFPVVLIHRNNREGFKAGALKNGLNDAKGEFIAIFDADFLPEVDFLIKTIPHFKDNQVGVVQTRWDHLNRNYSVLTQLQAFALDAHFTSEQNGRNANGFFINFNGTAGVWRKVTIIDAGGWEADTLTEDLDLSYRAQLKGWKFVYRGDILSPAELPVTMSALKSQQFRWTKGGAETFRKMAGRILKTPGITFGERLNGLAHLFNSSVFVFVLLLSLTSIGLLYLATLSNTLSAWLDWVSVFFVSTLFLLFYFA
ncbi:MAG: glycosyltransferase, partial [Crocinitomicaceae bacterium]|nr:glycosyltransferase [Crocinitomicaceae bacterium]